MPELGPDSALTRSSIARSRPRVTEPAERLLAAILSADVAGYSRLMADDEDSTVRALRAWRE